MKRFNECSSTGTSEKGNKGKAALQLLPGLAVFSDWVLRHEYFLKSTNVVSVRALDPLSHPTSHSPGLEEGIPTPNPGPTTAPGSHIVPSTITEEQEAADLIRRLDRTRSGLRANLALAKEPLNRLLRENRPVDPRSGASNASPAGTVPRPAIMR